MNNLNQFIAVCVMGWQPERSYYVSRDGVREYLISNWRPHNTVAQAMRCLVSFQAWEASYDHLTGAYVVNVALYYDADEETKWDGFAEEDTLSMAVSLASARARGYQDE